MGDNVKKKTDEKKSRRSDLPIANLPCIELSGNREMLIEGSRGVLEYSPACIRINTAGMILSAEDKDGRLVLLTPSDIVTPGCQVG